MSIRMSWLARVSVCVLLALTPALAAPAFADGQSQVKRVTKAKRTAAAAQISQRDLECLSEALYFEARGESVKGQFAVADVIMNRVEHAQFPDTVCGVIHQGTGRKFACQFTYTCDGHAEVIAEPRAFARVGKIAQMVIKGKKRGLAKGATHYHTRSVNPRWARVYPRVATIGFHHFYKRPTRVSSN